MKTGNRRGRPRVTLEDKTEEYEKKQQITAVHKNSTYLETASILATPIEEDSRKLSWQRCTNMKSFP